MRVPESPGLTDSSENSIATEVEPADSLERSFDFLYEEVKELQGKRILSFIEKNMIKRAISDTGGNQAKAAEILNHSKHAKKTARRIRCRGWRFR